MTTNLALTCAALVAVTLITRVGPLFAGEWLREHPWVKKLANDLPCMILVLLLLYESEKYAATGFTGSVATLAGIGISLAIHYWRRIAILSIIAGVGTFMAILWLLK